MRNKNTYRAKFLLQLSQQEKKSILADITPQIGTYCGEGYSHILTIRRVRYTELCSFGQITCGNVQYAAVGFKPGDCRRGEIEIYLKEIPLRRGLFDVGREGLTFLCAAIKRCG